MGKQVLIGTRQRLRRPVPVPLWPGSKVRRNASGIAQVLSIEGEKAWCRIEEAGHAFVDLADLEPIPAEEASA